MVVFEAESIPKGDSFICLLYVLGYKLRRYKILMKYSKGGEIFKFYYCSLRGWGGGVPSFPLPALTSLCSVSPQLPNAEFGSRTLETTQLYPGTEDR